MGVANDFGDLPEARAWKLARVGQNGSDVDVIALATYEELVLRYGYAINACTRWAEGKKTLETVLKTIIEWDEREKPHKNIPLSDCADLARKALGAAV